MKTADGIHNLAESSAATELLLRVAHDPSRLKMPFGGLNGADFLWLIALPAIALGLLQFHECRRPERVVGEGSSLRMIPVALVMPFVLLLVVAVLYVNAILQHGVVMLACVVFPLATGAVITHVGFRLIAEWLESDADELDHGNWAKRESAAGVIVESFQIAWLVLLLRFLPLEGSCLGVFMYALGQILVARMNIVAPDGLVTDRGNQLFDRLLSTVPRQSVIFVGVVYVLSLCLGDFEAAGIELLMALLCMRLVIVLLAYISNAWLSPLALGSLPDGARRELRWWIDGTVTVAGVMIGGFVMLHVFRSPAFWLHADLWWLFSLVVATGLITRLALDAVGSFYGQKMTLEKIAPGPVSMLSISAIRVVEGVLLVACLLLADKLVWVDPLSRLAADLKGYNAWAFAAVLVGYGYCLGDLVSGVPFELNRNLPSGTMSPEVTAPRYDVECLALAVVGIVLLADAFEQPLVQFSIMNTKNAVGALCGVLLHGLMFPFAMAVPVDHAKNSSTDRAVANVRRIHGFLALFFIHLGLGVAVPLFSVFAFASCLLVMTLIDVFVGAGKTPDERFTHHTFVLFGFLGLAIGVEMIRVFGTQGVRFLLEFPFIGHWLGDAVEVNTIRYTLASAIAGFSVWIGFSLYRRGLAYRVPGRAG